MNLKEQQFSEAIEYLEESNYQTLSDYLEKVILSKYNKSNNIDDAHKEDHIKDVLEKALLLGKELNLNDREIEIIQTSAIMHDIGLLDGDRENHNKNSAKIVRNDKFLNNYFSKQEIDDIANAVEDHRASLSYEPRNIYGKIISTSDRNLDIDNIITRIIQFRLKRGTKNYDEILEDSYKHFKEKYGRNGYLKLPIKTKITDNELSIVYSYENKEKFKKKFDEIFKSFNLKETIECLEETLSLKAIKESLPDVKIGSAFKDNEVSIHLYKKLGFKETGRVRMEKNRVDIRMERGGK